MTGSKCFLLLGKNVVGEINPDSSEGNDFFRYSENWKKEGFALSPTLPLNGKIKKTDFLLFLENLLPEGRALEHLSRLNNISKNNVLALCLAIGNDLAGALRLSLTDNAPDVAEQIRPITFEEIVQKLDFPDTHPIDIWDGKPRLSVAGMQAKINVLKVENNYALVNGERLCSTHILKFESAQKHLLLNEFLTTKLAKSLGFPVAELNLKRIGSHRVLEVTRFDRAYRNEQVLRRPMIDACQALGLSSSLKYEQNFGTGRDVAHIRDGASFKKLFSLTRFATDPLRMMDNFLHWMLFNVVIGNCDAHGKNFSFFVGKDGLTPTPWYDLVSVCQIPQVQQSLAMSIGDEFELEHLHALQILCEAQSCGLDFEDVCRALTHVLDSIDEELDRMELSDDFDEEEKKYIVEYRSNISARLRNWRKELELMPKIASDKSLF